MRKCVVPKVSRQSNSASNVQPTDSICNSDKRDRPNVRTLNTLLRGGLWTAATDDGTGKLAGGLVTSEASWELFKRNVSTEDMDCSSYEYFIAQLCYALRVEEAKDAIEEMKRKNNLTTDADLNATDPSVVESHAVSLVALARALTLLDRYDEATVAANNALNAAATARRLFENAKPESSSQQDGSSGGESPKA